MSLLLERLKPTNLRLQPFPHLVTSDALPQDLVNRLLATFPSLEVVTEGRPFGSNQRYSYAAHKLLADPRISDIWKTMVADQLTQGFLDRLLELFGPAIQERYPKFGEGSARRLRAGVRRQDSYRESDVLLEAQICVNTPVTATATVRGPHVDMPDKLFAGLFYLHHRDDHSRGGDLQLYRYRCGRSVLNGQFIDLDNVEVIDTVPYESNVLVLFLNSIDTVHGVSPREPTDYPRLFLNLFGELPQPLFDLTTYQKRRSLSWRVRYA